MTLPAPVFTLLPALTNALPDAAAALAGHRGDHASWEHSWDALANVANAWGQAARERAKTIAEEGPEANQLVDELLTAWWWAGAHLVARTETPDPRLSPVNASWTLRLLRGIVSSLDELLQRQGQARAHEAHRQATGEPLHSPASHLREALSRATAEANARFQWTCRAVYGKPVAADPIWTDIHGVNHEIEWADSPETAAAIAAWYQEREDVHAF